jgi:hypothetical protein
MLEMYLLDVSICSGQIHIWTYKHGLNTFVTLFFCVLFRAFGNKRQNLGMNLLIFQTNPEFVYVFLRSDPSWGEILKAHLTAPGNMSINRVPEKERSAGASACDSVDRTGDNCRGVNVC